MDLFVVFLLILVILSIGQSINHSTYLCSSKCPAGYYKTGFCENPAGTLKCQECEKNKYTAFENTLSYCFRCDICKHYQREISRCNSSSNVVCGCTEGYFNAATDSSELKCKECNCNYCKGPQKNLDYMKQCKLCERKDCLSDPDCKRECAETTDPTSAPKYTPIISKGTTGPAAGTTTARPSNGTEDHAKNTVTTEMTFNLNVFLVVMVIFVVLSGLMLLLHLFWNKLVRQKMAFCCRTNKCVEPDADDTTSKEKGSNQDLTTLTFNISEETHMLGHCAASPQHPATDIFPLLPNVQQEAVRQDKQSDPWPAIVLYAVIKEVPLRRWKEFLRLLLVADQQLERIELEAGLGSMEKQYQMLRLWSQCSSASLSDVFSALHYMDLSGCAQLLQENLDKLQWTPKAKCGFMA